MDRSSLCSARQPELGAVSGRGGLCQPAYLRRLTRRSLSLSPLRAAQVMKIIESSLPQGLSVSQLARELRMNVVYFSRCFTHSQIFATSQAQKIQCARGCGSRPWIRARNTVSALT